MNSLSKHGREVIKNGYQFDDIKIKIIYTNINSINKDKRQRTSWGKHSANKNNTHIKYSYKPKLNKLTTQY